MEELLSPIKAGPAQKGGETILLRGGLVLLIWGRGHLTGRKEKVLLGRKTRHCYAEKDVYFIGLKKGSSVRQSKGTHRDAVITKQTSGGGKVAGGGAGKSFFLKKIRKKKRGK